MLSNAKIRYFLVMDLFCAELLKRSRVDDCLSPTTKRLRSNENSPASSLKENHRHGLPYIPISKWAKALRIEHIRRFRTASNNLIGFRDIKSAGRHRSHFLCQSPGNSGYVPSLLSSPGTKMALRTRLGSPLRMILNKRGSPTKAMTNTGEVLRRSAKTQRGHTYTSAASKPKDKRCTFNKLAARTDIKCKFAPLTRFNGIISLNESRLNQFLGMRKNWPTSQRSVMGISAEDAARAAGIKVRGEFHWLHLFAFSMGGYDGLEPNDEQNLILGTAGANGFHLRMEDTIKELVRKHGEIEVRYSIDPTQDEFDAKWHLCGRFIYEFWTQGKFVDSIEIDTLSIRFASLTDNTLFTAFGEVAIERNKARSDNSSDTGC